MQGVSLSLKKQSRDFIAFNRAPNGLAESWSSTSLSPLWQTLQRWDDGAGRTSTSRRTGTRDGRGALPGLGNGASSGTTGQRKKAPLAQGKDDSPGRTAQPDDDRKVQEFMQGIPIIAGKNKAEIAMILAVAAATVDAYYD